MLSFLRHNQPIMLVVLPILALVLFLPSFFAGALHSFEVISPVASWVQLQFIELPWLGRIITLAIIVGEAFLLNVVINKHRIFDRLTFMPAVVYVILLAGVPHILDLHPLVFVNLFLILVLRNLMSLSRAERELGNSFDAGLFISLAALFYFPVAILFVVWWLGLIYFSSMFVRGLIISSIAFTVPFLYLGAYFIWVDSAHSFYDFLQVDFSIRVLPGTTTIAGLPLSTVLVFTIVLTLNSFVGLIGINKVRMRRILSLMVWFATIAVIAVYPLEGFGNVLIAIAAIPGTIYFSTYYLNTTKQWMGELMFWLLIITGFSQQILL